MYKRITNILMVTAMLLVSITALSQANGNGPKLTLTANKAELGKIKAGTVAIKEFTFKNTGKEPLIINAIVTSCNCLTADWSRNPVAPGHAGSIKLTLNSTGKKGNLAVNATVRYDTNRTATLQLKATISSN